MQTMWQQLQGNAEEVVDGEAGGDDETEGGEGEEDGGVGRAIGAVPAKGSLDADILLRSLGS